MQMTYTDSLELEHYGILGMKWGVRRTPEQLGRPTRSEKKELKTAKRHVSAAKRNLRWKGDTYKEAEENILTAKENYEAASKKMALFRKNRLARMKEASEKLTEAFEMAERPRSEMEMARKIYNDAAKEMWDINNKLVEKYGKTKVKDIKTYNMQFGITNYKSNLFSEEYTSFEETVIDTGLTVANIPFYGQRYTGKYISEKEIPYREEEFNKKARKNF